MPKITPNTSPSEQSDGSNDPCGAYEALLMSDGGALTQFGAFVEILPPNSKSSIKHWHMKEDEMVYMLEGKATVIEGDTTYTLNPGDAATFKAGVPLGHCVQNNSNAPVKYLVIGTRSLGDTVTYPDNNSVLTFEREDDGKTMKKRTYTTLDGLPATSPYD